MLRALRRGQTLGTSIRTISSTFSSCSKTLSHSPKWTTHSRISQPSISHKLFHTTVPQQQQAAAQVADHGGVPQQQYTKFQELADNGIVHPTIIDTITRRMRITDMTDIQRLTLHECLGGTDMVGQAKTGTGKTLAFLLPIVQRMLTANPDLAQSRRRGRYGSNATVGDVRALIISPTRELAEQIAVEASKLTDGTGIVVQTAVGGTQKNFHLRKMQSEGCHILVGTPGRLNDILSDQYTGVSLSNIDAFVLDEADRLLDIGFSAEIEQIKSNMPKLQERDRQTMMFSATIASSVVGLVRRTMKPDFKFIRTVSADETPVHERVPQKAVFLQGMANQMPALFELAQRAIEAHKADPTANMPFKAIVYFGSTMEVQLANETFNNLSADSSRGGRWGAHPLAPASMLEMHSRLSQQQRTRNSETFRRAQSAILFSSDVTARGMDFPNVSHVIQFGLPRATEDYIHRIGRTGRAGKAGEGWLFLSEMERNTYRRDLSQDVPIQEDDSLSTAKLDMTRDAQLPAKTAQILSQVQNAVRAVPFSVKGQAYTAMLGAGQQKRQGRQQYYQMLNDLTRYGWGLSEPPKIPSGLANRLGLDGFPGMNISDDFSSRGNDRGRMGGRDRGFGGSMRGGGRGGGSQTDPFGRPVDSSGRPEGRYEDSRFGGSRGGYRR
ncbi:MAG: hypothetical protein Q9160_003204 [Pyrenula sp. 1 TL-2023]